MSLRRNAVGLVCGVLCVCAVVALATAAEEPAPKSAAAVAAAGAAAELPPLAPPDKDGFIPLFNGKDMTGWVGAVKGYDVANGVMICEPTKAGGNVYTAHEFDNFIFRFEFKLPPGANNGVGIRAPLTGDAAYVAMEIQILEDSAPQYAKLAPWQYHGSIYGVVAAKRGHQKPVGEWNEEEIQAIGPKIKVTLNGVVIVDADLDEVRKTADPKLLKAHPGLNRTTGHIGWLGHGDRVEFRNVRIKPVTVASSAPASAPAAKSSSTSLSAVLAAAAGVGAADAPAPAASALNAPPEGFTALFNGKDLTGWKGLVGSPPSRAKMTPEQLAAAQAKADESMRQHWKIEDATLVFDGKGGPLCTAKDYGDFEMFVDWKIEKGGDSGIYLRGSPQVQIWDNKVGSGGLYNNAKNAHDPLVFADNPVEKWNSFRIKMVGERVWVWLNGKLVVDNTIMENYWERSKPIYPTGQIELQNHGSTLWFRNIYLRELPREATKPAAEK
jgi:hypothetical protein